MLDNMEHQRLENLRRVDRDAYETVTWLRENQHLFKGVVYEPIMTQINMKNIKDAVYLESIVSFNDMKVWMFLTAIIGLHFWLERLEIHMNYGKCFCLLS